MLYFVFTTAACNLSCTYCGSSPEDLMMPIRPTYDPADLCAWLKQDPDPTVIFYGGEPLLNMKYVRAVMDGLSSAKFIFQTNATMLHKFPTEYLLRVHAILVSIDGETQTFDSYRGNGTHDLVLQNVRDARERGFTGPVVARMACSLRNTIDKDVIHLAYENSDLFDMVYWQMDAEWDAPMNVRWGEWAADGRTTEDGAENFDEDVCGFEAFLRHSYMPGIARLWDRWVSEMEKGNFSNIVPFTGVARGVIFGDTALSHGGVWCSCGHNAFSVCTDGRIQICPVGFGEAGDSTMWNFMGTIESMKNPLDLPAKAIKKGSTIGEPCTSCDIYETCGGRCLYANQTKHWGEDGFQVVCGTVRQLHELAERDAERIKALIERGVVSRERFMEQTEKLSLEVIP